MVTEPSASVSQEPEKDFIFPTGRPWAEDLGYPAELANVPETAVGSFAGVANPWQLGRLAPGERVLDLGSGAGTDSLVAAQMVGEHGHVNRIDMTPEMLARARGAAAEMDAANVEFVESEAELKSRGRATMFLFEAMVSEKARNSSPRRQCTSHPEGGRASALRP